MGFAAIKTGSVIRYPYLWRREALSGEAAGRKDRLVVVAVRLTRADCDQLLLLAITTKRPAASTGLEIPETERRRAGLDPDRPLWVIVSETNFDIVGRSHHLRPEAPIGRFSRSFVARIRQAFAEAGGLSGAVSRRE